MKKLQMPMLLGFACACIVMSSHSAEVTADEARLAARNWVVRNPSPLSARFAACDGAVETLSDQTGRALCHVVNLEGGGFVITSGDTKIAPIVAFSDKGTLVNEAGNPLVSILRRGFSGPVRRPATSSLQAQARREASAMVQSAAASPVSSSDLTESEREWAELLAEGSEDDSPRRIKSVSSSSGLSDVCVAPLVKSLWDQRTWARDPTFPHAFNWYLQDCPCGCVATAASQVMRMFRYPTASMPKTSFACTLEAQAKTYAMNGDIYDWDNMPLKWIENGRCITITDGQAQAISRVTWDVGVACHMNYTSGNSTTSLLDLRKALLETFGFKSAEYAPVQIWNGYYEEDFYRATYDAMLASLNAGMPVFGGIFDYVPDDPEGFFFKRGHCILFDGYGRVSSTVYVHMNCGYSGVGDVWYKLFSENLVDVSQFSDGQLTLGDRPYADYDFIACLLYNVHPKISGDVISGRISDPSGRFVSGATVKLMNASGAVVGTTTSDGRGIYAFRVPSAGTNFVKAEKTTSTSSAVSQSTRVIREEASVSPASDFEAFSIGNRWDVNLVLEPKPLEQVKMPTFTPRVGSYSGSSVSVSISCSTAGATIHYTTDGTMPTSASAVYSSSIVVTGTTTIRAVACKSGMADSDIATQKYEKNVFTTAGNLAAALDYSGGAITFSVDQPDYVKGQTSTTYDGVDALQFAAYGKWLNGFVGMAASPVLTATVTGPGTLKFMGRGGGSSWMGISCQLDGVSACSIDAMEWEERTVTIGAGSHKVTWTCSTTLLSSFSSKTVNTVVGTVIGYLDQLTFVSGPVSKRTVHYHMNGAESGSLSTPSTFAYPGEQVTLPTGDGLTREGYLFGGWNTKSDGSGKSYWKGTKYTVGDDDCTLYAKWCKIVDVPFDYPAAGGSYTFDLSEFSGFKFHGVGTLPEWASFGARDEYGNMFFGAGLTTLSMRSGMKIAIGVDENPEESPRTFSWMLLSEECQTVPRFNCVQQGNASHILSSVQAEGPSSVVGGATAQLNCFARYRDGKTAKVTSASWSVRSGSAYASINASTGLLTARSATASGTVTVAVSYTEGGVTRSATLEVMVLPERALSAALGATAPKVTSESNASGWRAQSAVKKDGEAALCCGSCLDASPWFEMSLAPGEFIAFNCRLSPGSGRRLRVLDNGVEAASRYSLVDNDPWWPVRYETSEDRSHTIRIVYEWVGAKTGWESAADCAWIDAVKVGDPDDVFVSGAYTVKFVANGGAGTKLASVSCKVGGVYALPKNTYVNGTKRFVGWRSSANGRLYDDETLIFNLAAEGEVVTMTAVWE